MRPVQQPDHPLHAGINTRLAQIAAASPAPLAWYAAWRRLGPGTRDAARLAFYRSLRDSGSLPDDAGFFLVAWMLDLLIDSSRLETSQEADDWSEAVRSRVGLDDDGGPNEEVAKQAHAAWDSLYAATLEEHGEPDMAWLFRTDPEQFHERYEAGRRFFHGSKRSSQRQFPATA